MPRTENGSQWFAWTIRSMSDCDVVGTGFVITGMILDSLSKSPSEVVITSARLSHFSILSEPGTVQPTSAVNGRAYLWRNTAPIVSLRALVNLQKSRSSVSRIEQGWASLLCWVMEVGRGGHFKASMRSSATRAQRAVSGSTLIRLTGVPCARFSRHQARWGMSIRYMVAHMQTMGERKWIVLSGFSCGQTIDQVQLGPDRPGRAGGGLFDCLDDELGRAHQVRGVDDLHHAFGMDQDLDARKPAPELLDMAGLNIWWTEQWPFQSRTRLVFDRSGGVSAQAGSRGPRPPSGRAGFPSSGRCSGPGAGRGRTRHAAAPGERPFQHGPGVGAGANDAAVPSAERLELGRSS